MADTRLIRLANRRYRDFCHRLAQDLERQRLDAGLSQHALARAAGVHQSEVSRFEAGKRIPGLDDIFAIATALGTEPSLRFFETPGLRIVDRTQAAITEALLAVAHPRWQVRLEVGVSRPVRGVIDLVLASAEGDIVASEVQGELRRAEQQVRWSGEKADALASAAGWPWNAAPPPVVHRLLVLRSSMAARSVVRSLPAFFQTAYPADEADAYAALTSSSGRWPGNAMLWAHVEGQRTRILRAAPRGIGR